MLNRDQAQNVAEGSTAIQAGRDVTVTNVGLTYADVRDVALDVFRANFYHLSATASTIAVTRAEEMTEKFFERLLKENPSGLSKANDPDFQYALLTAQREYARSGDKDLGDVLIDLLVDRSKQNERDILQIVLNESLTVVPKLTEGQLAILALVFLFRYTRDLTTLNPETLGKYFDTYASPFVAKAPSNNASYQHLEFTGCGAISMGEIHLEAILGDHYRGLFQQGFDARELSTRSIIIGSDNNGLFMRSFYDSTKLQLNAMSQEVLSSKFGEYNISPADNKIGRAHV